MDPLIGITDFNSFQQVEQMLAVLEENKQPGSKRRLHVGVMMSRRMLCGRQIEYEWEKSILYPRDVPAIFASPSAYNCLHYADFEPGVVDEHLYDAIMCGGTLIDGLQLDMCWPRPDDVANAVHASRKQIEVILQIGKQAMRMVNGDPMELVDKLEDYDGVIHRVLLDMSMGKGVGMDAEALLPYLRAIREHLPDLGLVVAGGLGPETTHLLEPIVQEFPEISIDAQGRLRPSGSALDPIDWNMAAEYLKQALRLLK